MDIYLLERLHKLLHGPINVFDREGNLIHSFEEGVCQPVAPREFQGKGKEKPYIKMDGKGVAYAVIQSPVGEYIVLGRIRVYYAVGNDSIGISYCGKDEFRAIIELCWKSITGQEMPGNVFWNVLEEPDASIAKHLTNDMLHYQERRKAHNPIRQERREQESIRRGDLQALEESINESYGGEIGNVSKDVLRHYKNIAIWVISSASRSAIQGGVTPEKALSMCDSFLRNVEDNLQEPLEVEKATREAEFIFAREVRDLQRKNCEDVLTSQVRNYIYLHIMDKLQVTDIAKEFDVTPNYLSDRFRKQEGISLKQYIINEKIEASEYFLKYTDKSIGEISEHCAFGSQSRFTQYFRERHGVTPSAYRRIFQLEHEI